MEANNKKMWLRAKIVMQFLFLRERLDFTQQEIVDKMGVMCQLITRFDNMSNSLIIFILVKWANELEIKTWYYFEWELLEYIACAFFTHTANDWKVYNDKYYILDVVISVGYFVKSKRGVLSAMG